MHSSILAWRAAVAGSHRLDTSEVTEHPRGAEQSPRDGDVNTCSQHSGPLLPWMGEA